MMNPITPVRSMLSLMRFYRVDLNLRVLTVVIAILAAMNLSLIFAQEYSRLPLVNGAEKIRIDSDSGLLTNSNDGPLRIQNLPENYEFRGFADKQTRPEQLPCDPQVTLGPFDDDLQVNQCPIDPRIELVHFNRQLQPVQSAAPDSGTMLPNPVSFSLRSERYFDSVDTADTFQLHTSLEIPTVCPIFVSPANQNCRGHELLSPYQARTESYRAAAQHETIPELKRVPEGFSPWWISHVAGSSESGANQLSISLDTLLQMALRHSPHVQVAATEPHIRQTLVFEEAAQFDWQSFLETKYDDTNDPIGNELTTGNNSRRFTQQEFYARGGLRRRNTQGGEVDLAQRIGYLDNNSRFLIPPDQGSSRLELNYRQPVLQGRGQAVNESLIMLANLDFHSASDDFLEQLQSHLSDVTETYWELVRARSEYFQRLKLLGGAERVLENLQGRSEVDALDRQVYRARAAVANRRAEIARAMTSIKNAESRLRLLVNEPSLINTVGSEFTPLDTPLLDPLPINLADALSTALANRPDISKAIRDLRAAHVRLGVARNDVLPKLDFLLGTYVAGLDGDSDITNSWINQFRDGRPGFNFGLDYELPVGNRAAQAAQQRRQWEVTRSLHQFRAVVETGLNEVEIAVREVVTSHREMTGRYHSMNAATNETEFLIDRWQTLPGIDDSVTLLLEDLLDSQERLADEEAAFARAQFDYAVAIVKLKQAMGTLFTVDSGNHG